jgi:hypothetical protein
MYVAPTPFALAEGVAHRRTLILPADQPVEADLVEVGTLTRREIDNVVVAYSFDLQTNELQTTLMPNADAGREHVFKAYRLKGEPFDRVSLRTHAKAFAHLTEEDMQRKDDDEESLPIT